MSSRSRGPNTRAVHSPMPDFRVPGDPLSAPIVAASSFAFPSVEAMEGAITEPGSGYVYSRVVNPTVDAMERAVASLEGAEAAVGLGSGMAAIHAGLLGTLNSGDHVLAPASLYGGAYALLTRLFPRLGIETTFVEDATPAGFAAAMKPETRVIYTESIGNPLMRVPDLAALAKLAHDHGAKLVVDSTLASPSLCRPLEHGADVVVHSTSKYLGGHGDVIAGVVAGSAAEMNSVRGVSINAGGTLSPFTAFLVSRGIRTLPLRMRQHTSTALELARFLEAHPKVGQCWYPGLESHPDYAHARATLDGGFGAVIGFVVDGGDAAGSRLADALELFHIAGSLGDTHSLVVQPALSSHRTLDPAARAKAGIAPGFVRLSIGLEDAVDLREDLEAALSKI